MSLFLIQRIWLSEDFPPACVQANLDKARSEEVTEPIPREKVITEDKDLECFVTRK